MVDQARVERIRMEVRGTTTRANRLIERVADEQFKEIVTRISIRITGIESFFLDKADRVIPENGGLWLGGAEMQLAGEIASLRYYEDAALARNYKISLF
jgi:hypothetical protein